MDSNRTSLDPFDFSDWSGSISATTGTSISVSQTRDDTERSTYGNLVKAIHNFGSRVLRYHNNYLETRHFAPNEEAPQRDFVSKGDYLCAGADFVVFSGFLFKDYNASPSFPRRYRDNKDFGDHKFVKPSSGTTAGVGLYIPGSSEPTRVAVALKESVLSIHEYGKRPFVLGTFLKEIKVMGELSSCENVVDLLGVAFVEVGEEVKPTLVVDLALGNLIDFFRSQSSSITWRLKGHLTLQITDALQALHKKGIIHADIKAQNVLVFPHERTQYCAKLSDFGNSVPIGKKLPLAAGTMCYLPPECLGLEGYPGDFEQYGNSEYRDVYTLGLLVWEIVTNCEKLPFSDKDSDEISRLKSDGKASQFLLSYVPKDSPSYLLEIITGTLQNDPTQRTSLDVILEMLNTEIKKISAMHPLPTNTSRSQSPERGHEIITDGESLPKIPWSLQKRLHDESLRSSDRDVDSKVFLAYCYILCSDSYQYLRENALHVLRQAASLDPFYLVSDAKLTPFRAMMELQDWQGLSDILLDSGGTIVGSEFSRQSTQNILSFGWNRFIVLACSAGVESPLALTTIDSDATRVASEKVAVASIQLLAHESIGNVGQASWGSERLTALHMAAVSGKPRAVSVLLTNGADSNARGRDNHTPLHLACQATFLSDDLSVQVAQSFFEHSPSSVNDVMHDTLYTPLRFAIEAEKLQLCKFLVQNGADVNACAAEGSTALLECAWTAGEKGCGRRDEGCKDEAKALEFARVLLECGRVEINMRSCHNSVTALGIAAAHSNFVGMVSLLLDYGADPNTSVDDLTPLSAAVQYNNQEMISVLLERGADPNFSVRNVTPLGLAALLDRHQTTPFLLERGADPTIPHQGIPLVGFAIAFCQNNKQEDVCPNFTLLLQHGASIAEIAQPTHPPYYMLSGWSAIHFAALKLSISSLNVLLDHNAPLSARTQCKETALHVAMTYSTKGPIAEGGEDMLSMLKQLVQHGVDLDATNIIGETVLHIASRNHWDAIRDYLLQAGCNPDLKDCFGRTAQQLYELDKKTAESEERAKYDMLEQQQEPKQ